VRRDDLLFELKDRDGVLKPGLLVFLTRAAAVTRAAFPAGASTPAARFSIQIQGTAGVAETIVDVDGQKVSYRNGPLEWKPLTWPGGGGRPGASIKLRGAGLNEELAGEGEWGLFRLLDRARLEAGASPSGFVAAWKLQSRPGEVKIAFKPVQRSNPFLGEERPALFPAFRARDLFPPRTIAKGQECTP
jgi:type VI secretion system protein ImpL